MLSYSPCHSHSIPVSLIVFSRVNPDTCLLIMSPGYRRCLSVSHLLIQLTKFVSHYFICYWATLTSIVTQLVKHDLMDLTDLYRQELGKPAH